MITRTVRLHADFSARIMAEASSRGMKPATLMRRFIEDGMSALERG